MFCSKITTLEMFLNIGILGKAVTLLFKAQKSRLTLGIIALGIFPLHEEVCLVALLAAVQHSGLQ
jgi:hypothetical protein